MGRYQPLGKLVEVREAKERRVSRAIEMFKAGETPLTVSRKLGLSRVAMQKLRQEWAASQVTADFDPALAIGTIDEFLAKPLPQGVSVVRSGKCEPKRSVTPYKERFPSKEADDEAWALESPLLTATDRALKLRTPEAYAAVLALMGKGT